MVKYFFYDLWLRITAQDLIKLSFKFKVKGNGLGVRLRDSYSETLIIFRIMVRFRVGN